MATLETKIDGATLLGFLAAIGVLRLLTEASAHANRGEDQRPRLRFRRAGDRAEYSAPWLETPTAIVADVVTRLRADLRDQELAALGDASKPGDVTRQSLIGVTTTPFAQFFAGLVCDEPPEGTSETTLCAANGAGHQNMFTTMRDLRRLATDEHVRTTLTEEWRFEDDVSESDREWMGNRKPTLRWDEGSERLYALRLHKPTSDPVPFRTQFGAYALAAVALPCFPVVPTARGGQTVFTARVSSTETSFHWPLWDRWVSLPAFQALQASGEPLTDPSSARRRGIYRLLRATRVTQDKGKLTFFPAEALW